MRGVIKMKKTYKVDVDCANCANKMEDAVKNTKGVKDAVLNFMTLKLKVEFEDGSNPQDVMQDAVINCKKATSDGEILL
ncbi:heavy metal-associated domain protein [Megasphaera hutchinsoni]|uniref:Heavy metal-associated domain protein n=2 Tax=Megasphaera TaxID=906 RepID=A0A134CHL1_9FIRM|nr:heavy metal-associated domain protein [Megasphaera hutchinsoni]